MGTVVIEPPKELQELVLEQKKEEEAPSEKEKESFLRRLIYALAGYQRKAFEAPAKVAPALGQAVEVAYPAAESAYQTMVGTQAPAYQPAAPPAYYYTPPPRYIRTGIGVIDLYALNSPGIYGEINRMRWEVFSQLASGFTAEIEDALWINPIENEFNNIIYEAGSAFPLMIMDFIPMFRELRAITRFL